MFFFYTREGDITQLRVDAIVHSTNENFSDHCPLSNRIFTKAGHGLKQEIYEDIKGLLKQLNVKLFLLISL